MPAFHEWGWEGVDFKFDDKKVVIEEQLTEYDDERMAQRHVLALARAEKPDKTTVKVMLKIRFEYVLLSSICFLIYLISK